MHKEAMEFLKDALAGLPIKIERVLEIGSLDINGSAKVLFGTNAVEYIGIDKRPGRGVDWQVDARWFHGWEAFDLVITTETLEHESKPRKIIDCAWRSLRDGGYLVITTAAPGRPPHAFNGGPVGDEPFTTLDESQMLELLYNWADVEVYSHKEHRDTYAIARKSSS